MEIAVSRLFVLLVLFYPGLTGAKAAHQDRTAELEKAKTKFTKDIAKADEALQAKFDKAIAKAKDGGSKMVFEKLAYERELFTKDHIVPTALSSETYLQQRNQAITALQAVYKPAIADLTKAKKFDELAVVEDELCDLLKSARGYGLAFPNLETHPVFMIESLDSGEVIDTTGKGVGQVVLTPKLGKRKPTQCWVLEREPKGFVIRSVESNHAFAFVGARRDAGATLGLWPVDLKKDVAADLQFKLIDVRREIIIESFSGLVLTATEKKEKGITTIYITQQKQEEKVPPTQLWKLVEVK
jgi:hypothetical protein